MRSRLRASTREGYIVVIVTIFLGAFLLDFFLVFVLIEGIFLLWPILLLLLQGVSGIDDIERDIFSFCLKEKECLRCSFVVFVFDSIEGEGPSCFVEHIVLFDRVLLSSEDSVLSLVVMSAGSV